MEGKDLAADTPAARLAARAKREKNARLCVALGWLSGAAAFILVKPQFEAPKHEVPPGGVVTDENVRAAMVEKVKTFARERLNWTCEDVMPSPIKGPKGNQEYVAVFRKP